MPTFAIAGHDIHVEQRGSGEEPLLLVMGMSGNTAHWGEPFLELLDPHFALTLFDHRGVGRSGRAEAGFTLADLAADAVGVLDAVGLDTAHVLGISMGGMAAQELAIRHSERLRTLALGCTMAGGEGQARIDPAVVQRLFEPMQSGDRAAAVRAGWEANVSRRYAADAQAWASFQEVAARNPAPVAAIMAQAQAILGHDTVGRLSEISAPTLVMHGDQDEMVPFGNAAKVAEGIPGARLEVFAGVGHLFFWEEPERSARLVQEHALAAVRAGTV